MLCLRVNPNPTIVMMELVCAGTLNCRVRKWLGSVSACTVGMRGLNLSTAVDVASPDTLKLQQGRLQNETLAHQTCKLLQYKFFLSLCMYHEM